MNFSYYPFKADKLFKYIEKFESKFVVDGEELIIVFEKTAEVIMLYDDHLNMMASELAVRFNAQQALILTN